MKRIIIYPGLLSILFLFQTILADAQKRAKLNVRGVASADIENFKKEADPKFAKQTTQKHYQLKNNQPSNRVPIASTSNGVQILQEATDRMIANEYKFTLLSGHKYMVNDCLGLKVSSGEFSLKFKNPVITFTEEGPVKIKLEVDHIKLSAIKIRIRPRTPDFSDPNPCHFSGKFEIKGEAKNLSVTAYIDPAIASFQPLGGSTTFCFLGIESAPKVDWVMNALDLIDFINSLDKAAKDMILDGLDFGMQNLLIEKFTDIVRDVWQKYYDACALASAYASYYTQYYVAEAVENNSKNEMAGNESKDAGTDKNKDRWKVTPTASKSIMGNLTFDFPEDAKWSLAIFEQETKEYIQTVSGSENKPELLLNAGKYRVVLNNVPVENVPIESGKNTRLEYGVLIVNSRTSWSIWDQAGKNHFKTENGGTRMVFPVGKYTIKIGGGSVKVELKEGETVEL